MEGDVESDLSVFHRVDDMSSMGSRRWATLVDRLPAYAGAVQYRIRSMSQDPVPNSIEPAAAGGGVVAETDNTPMLSGPPSPLRGKEIESSQVALKFSDVGDMFSFG